MALAIRRTTSMRGRLLTTLMAVFALVAQPMYALIASEVANAFSATVHSSDLSAWDLSESKVKGHSVVVSNGLHVWTDSNDGASKAAGYYATPGLALSDIDATSISFAPGSISGGRPSVQLGVDRDGDGKWDGYLVYEPWAYGEGQYWVDKPNFGVPAGGGYKSMGTLAQYKAANPKAKIMNIGYSLGSGVKGDAIISSIVIGGTTYSFGLPPVKAPAATISVPQEGGVVATTVRGGKLAVSGMFTDDKAVNYLQLELVRAGNSEAIYTMHYNNPGLSSNGSFAIDMPVPANLESGNYSLFYTGTDFEGGVTQRYERIFVIDNTNPETTLVAPTGLVGRTFTVHGVASDNQNLSRVYVQLVNRQSSQRYGGTTIHLSGTEQSWSRVYDAVNLNLPNGEYAAHVSVVDAVGNTASVGWSDYFEVDRMAPNVSIKAGTGVNDGTRGEHPYYRQISFKLNDPSGNLKEAVISNSLNGEKKYARSGTWNDLNWVNIDKSHLVQGENTILVRDTAGNQSAAVVFIYDSVAPSATFAYSNSNGNALTNADITVTMTTTEPIQTPTGWTWVSDTEFTRTYGNNGKYEVAITDIAGNVSVPQKFEVKRIDRNAPTITGVVNGATVEGPVTLVVFDPKYEGYDGFDKMHGLTVNGVEVPTIESLGKTYLYPLSGEGEYTVVATDKAGNFTTITFKIVAAAIPAVTVNAPTNTGDGGIPAPQPQLSEQQQQLFPNPSTGSLDGQEVANSQDTPGASNNGGEILGDQDKESGTPLEDTGEVLGLMDHKFFGLVWYLWLVIIAALIAGWLWLAARIRQYRAENM